MADNSRKDKKGFSGFDSMVSDIDKELADLGTLPPKSDVGDAPKRTEAPAIPLPVTTPRAEQPVDIPIPPVFSPQPKKPSGSGKVWGWVIGIAVVIWLANSGGKSQNSSPSTSYSTPSSSYGSASPSPAPPPAPAYVPEATYTPASDYEEKPPVGSGQTFNNAQIRYCLSEKIRMQGMQRLVDNYSENSVEGFNKYVNDYNARCSHFRYRSGALESVRGEVESRRANLESEGVSRALKYQ